MIRRQSLIAIGIAVVLGLVAVYLANVFLTANQQRADEAQVGTVRVAVASKPLDYGVAITPQVVRFANFPADSVPEGAFKSIADLTSNGGRVALMPIQVNEPILASKISGAGKGASIAALLPDGMRAASVRINDVSGVAGFIQPNDSVDVLITRSTPDGNRQITDVLLQNIRVMAMGQRAKDNDGKPEVTRTATLEVNPVDAQKLALAQQVGQLSLVLRKPGEEQNDPTLKTVSITDLRYSLYSGTPYSAEPAPVRRAAAPVRRPVPVKKVAREMVAPLTSSVEVVRGTQSSDYEVLPYGR